MEFIESVAGRAGTEAMKYFKHEKTNRISSKKTVKDLVSTADKAVEKVIIDAIRERYPEHDIYGEESGALRRFFRILLGDRPDRRDTVICEESTLFFDFDRLEKNGAAIADALCAGSGDDVFRRRGEGGV